MRFTALLILATVISAADDAAKLWTDHVQPILASTCYECHGPKKAKHNLRLDSKEGILAGGKELGPAVVASKPDESPLLKVIQLPTDEDAAMPPKGERLTAEQIGWIKDWIAGGAPMGAGPKQP